MTDRLKHNTKAWHRRQAIWKHNSFHGSARMMLAQCNAILDSKTANAEAKKIAQQIQFLAADLINALKDRIDDLPS